ncbi:hypothetical protein ABID58_003277 [Bradyrhizobium sp. S3.2.6]
MEWVSARAENFVRREFTVEASLWGRPGLSRNVVVLMVPPRASSGASPESAAQDFSASRRNPE